MRSYKYSITKQLPYLCILTAWVSTTEQPTNSKYYSHSENYHFNPLKILVIMIYYAIIVNQRSLNNTQEMGLYHFSILEW